MLSLSWLVLRTLYTVFHNRGRCSRVLPHLPLLIESHFPLRFVLGRDTAIRYFCVWLYWVLYRGILVEAGTPFNMFKYCHQVHTIKTSVDKMWGCTFVSSRTPRASPLSHLIAPTPTQAATTHERTILWAQRLNRSEETHLIIIYHSHWIIN